MSSSQRPRRKCVSVSFVGDDDVIEHIVDVEKKRIGKSKTAKSRRSDPIKFQEDPVPEEASDEDDESQENKPPTTLEIGEGQVTGSDVFQFKTPKKSGSMAQKATEARTPKSILKNAVTGRKYSEKSTPKTPDPSTPVRKSARVKPLRTGKLEATTPARLWKRVETICDDIEAESDSSLSSEDSDEEGGMTETQKTPSSATPKQRKKTPQVSDMPNMVEEYFDLHSGSGMTLTSDRTLAKLGTSKMDQESLSELLKKIPSNHCVECRQMYEEYRGLFQKWMFQICNGFNILLHGLGSKRSLIEDFRKTCLQDLDHVVVNGYFPSLTVKHILNTITDEILEVEGTYKNPLDQVEFIKSQFENKDYRDFFLIIHNIDGAMLRPEKTQNVLSLLSQIDGFHIIASIDHINAPLIWDQSKCSRFKWLWYDITTYMPYSDETSYENSLLVQQSGALALSSMTHVMKSLTPNAKAIFLILCKQQLENKDNSLYIGMSFHEMYQRCREAFLVNSDQTLRAQLIEFRDHKLIKSKKSYDGTEHLFIPIDTATLAEFVEQHDDA